MINLSSINLAGAGGTGGGQAATPNVDIFGAPVINGSQVSGFSTENYLQMPRVIDFAGTTWQLDFKFTTGANVTTQQNIVDSGFGLAIAVSQGGMLVAMSSNGISWDLGAHAGAHTVAPNTSYYVRMTFDGAKYTVGIGVDGQTYETDITVTSSASLYPRVIVIGKSTDNRYVFGGSINLADATLLVNGEVVWTGMKGGDYMSVNMSNITEVGKQKVNQIVNDGEVGQKLSELEEDTEILQIQTSDSDMTTLPTLCGQPMMLFGAGTPQEAIVPTNWKQYAPETGEGYQWNGLPSALGQVYINTAVNSNGRYTAVENGYGNLKWVNF